MAITPDPLRQITETEQALIRRDGQWSELFAAIDDPNVVFTALLDTANLPASNDGVHEIAIVSGAWQGDYARIYDGMTLRVGSAPGLSDLGFVRVRITYESGTTLAIGETSDIDWVVDPQADRYLTVVDEFRVWPRLLRMVGPTDSETLTGRVGYANGGTTLHGSFEEGTGSIANGWFYSQIGTGQIYRADGAPDFDTVFTVNQHCYIDTELPQIGYVVYVDPDWISINIAVLQMTDLVTVNVYPILTQFTSEVAVGDTVTIDGGESAEVKSIEDNAHLTVESAWSSSLESATYHTTTLEIYMDYDVPVFDPDAEVNQQYEVLVPPVVVMGGPIVIDGFVNQVVVQLDASGSYVPDAEVSSHGWDVTGGTISNANIASPTLTIAAAGTYRVSVQVHSAIFGYSSRTSVGHRKIYVFDRAHPPFTLAKLENCEGSVDAGGWSARLTVYGDSSAIRDQAEVVIFARDHYGATRQEIGQDAQRANIVMVGYIVGETITIDPELNTTTFEIAGPQAWLDRVMGVATAVEDSAGPPTRWTSMYHLTIDRALWHLFVWRTTFTQSHDLHLTGDTRRIAFLEGKLGSLISQVDQIAKQVVLARAVCDRNGSMNIQLDPQFVPSYDRIGGFVQALYTSDLRAPLSFQRRTVNEVARLTLSGTSWDGETPTPYVSTKQGGVFRTHGRIDSLQNLALDSQEQADLLARLVLAHRNNPFPSVPLPLAGINRLLDISPAMWVVSDLSDNPRIPIPDGLLTLIKRITYSYDPDTGEFTVDIDSEAWTDETTRIEGPPRVL